MHWAIYFILATVAFVLSLISKIPTAVVGLLLFAAFLLIVMGMFSLISNRISSRSRDDMHILSPEELRQLREQAEARLKKPTAPKPPLG